MTQLTDLIAGDRVDITLILTEEWQSAAAMKKARVMSVKLMNDGTPVLNLRIDDQSEEVPYHRFLTSGLYTTGGYKIEKSK